MHSPSASPAGPAPATPGRRERRRGPSLRQARLGTGLVLFAYVLTHLLNHALGNVSLAAMEDGLALVAALWLNPAALLVLYTALIGHLLLGLHALYERRLFEWRPAEAAQLALGLAIPALLLNHIVGTRIGFAAEGLEKGYAQVLYLFWTASPWSGAQQAAVLVVAWLHGCFGLYFWLRLKPGFGPASPWLLAVAILVPVLALLGFAQGGRAVAALARDPAWRAEALAPVHLGLPAQAERLAAIRDGLLAAYAAAVALVLAARGARTLTETRRGSVRLTYPDGRVVKVPRGTSVLEASRRNNIPHASVCGGRGRCSTCRVRVLDGMEGRGVPAAGAAERAVLDRIRASPGVRLACQFRPDRDLAVAPLFPPHPRPTQARMRERAQSGEEHFIAVMFVDLRGSTRLAQERLPYDTVFVINRFLGAVGHAVREAGGQANQFLGDGMMVLFGLNTDPETAARSALRAVEAIAEHVAALNGMLSADLGQSLRYGIGLHAGTAIVGEMGDEIDARFTALGDTVNVASRLQGLTKPLDCVAIVSEAVYAAARMPAPPLSELTVAGRTGTLRARLVANPGATAADDRSAHAGPGPGAPLDGYRSS